MHAGERPRSTVAIRIGGAVLGLLVGGACFGALVGLRDWPWRLALGAAVGTGGLVFVGLLTVSRLRDQLRTLREPWFGD